MDDDSAVELEQAIRDAATLLLRVDKYRRGRAADVAALRRSLAAVGARARRSHRAAGGGESMARLRDETRALIGAVETIITDVLGSPVYRRAVTAYGQEEGTTLGPLLLEIFADLTPGPAVGDLFAAIPWSGRRGARPPEDVVAAIDATRAEGFSAAADSLTPGADPELPAVTFGRDWPDGAPIALVCRAEDIAAPSSLGPAGQVLFHRPRVRVEFEVAFQTDRAAVDDWVEDLPRYRETLAPLLEAHGYVIREVPTPAAP